MFKQIISVAITLTVLFTAIPQNLSYQGLLTNPDGTVVTDGDYEISFKLFNSIDSNTPIWEQTQSVAVLEGLFSTKLNDLSQLDFTQTYWLDVEYNGNLLGDRTEFTASAYALNANQVKGNNIFPAIGNVGIGTSTPDENAKLHINRPSDIYGLKIEGEENQADILLRHNGAEADQKVAQLVSVGGKVHLRGVNDEETSVTNNLVTGDLATGKVGISTIEPEEQLHINNSDDIMTEILVENTDQRLRLGSYYESGVGQYSVIKSEQDDQDPMKLILNPDGGYVGIGTSAPSTRLDVNGGLAIRGDYPADIWSTTNLTVGTTHAIFGTMGSYWATMAWNGYRSVDNIWKTTGLNDYTESGRIEIGSSGIQFGMEDYETIGPQDHRPEIRMTIAPDGNVGINTTSPAGVLDVNGGVFVTGSEVIRDNGSQILIGNVDTQSGSHVRELIFRANGGDKMRISSAGNIGINVTPSNSSNRKLYVVADENQNAIIGYSPYNGYYGGYFMGSTHGLIGSAPLHGVVAYADSTIGRAIHAKNQLGDNISSTYTQVDLAFGDYGVYSSKGKNYFADEVGIGTLTPNEGFKLDVQGNLRVGNNEDIPSDNEGSGIISMDGNGYEGFITMDGSGMSIGHNSGSRKLHLETNETARLTVDADGDVGVGTTSPGAKLDVRDDNTVVQVKESFPVIVEGTNNGGALYFGVNASSASQPTAAIETSWGDTTTPQIGIGVIRETLKANILMNYSNKTYFRNGTTTNLFIDSDGDVGIGTASPNAKLDVVGVGDEGDFTSTVWQGQFGETGAGAVLLGTYENLPAIQGHGTSTGYDLLLNPTNGDVGIGTTSPSAKLDVAGDVVVDGSISVTEDIEFEGNIKLSDDLGLFSIRSSNEFFKISGYVTTAVPPYLADANNFTINTSLGGVGINALNYDSAFKLYIGGSSYSTGSWQGSDQNLKNNIQPITNSLYKILQLNGVTYNWDIDNYPDRGLTDKRQIGFIAQDIEKVFPEAVMENNDGLKAVNYDGLIGPLVEAIKEQQKMIESLQYRIEELENK